MVIRRILAALLVFLFVTLSVAALMIFAVSNTFLRSSFYTEDLKEAGYEFLVDSTVKSIEDTDGVISEYFIEEELREEVEKVFPPTLFDKTMSELVGEVETLKEDPNQPLTLKLSMYRESLLTLAHNLAFKIFESLPPCVIGQVPDEGSNGLPSCIPEGVEYNDVSGRLSQEFEKDIYAAVPEQVQFDVHSAVGEGGFVFSNLFASLDSVKMIFYGLLLAILALTALIVYRPFSAILMAEGVAFLLSGIVGFIVGYSITLLPTVLGASMREHYLNDSIVQLLSAMAGFFSADVQKGALVFLATGIILLAVRYYLKRR